MGSDARRPQAPGTVVIDTHSQILSLAEDPEFTLEYGREGSLRGVEAAVDELERAVTELGLSRLKLYPMYQHWAANDSPPDLRESPRAGHPGDDSHGVRDALGQVPT